MRTISLKVVDVATVDGTTKQRLSELGRAIGTRPILNIWDEVMQPDRQALDSILFNLLGLSSNLRQDLYRDLVGLVEARVKKAKSV